MKILLSALTMLLALSVYSQRVTNPKAVLEKAKIELTQGAESGGDIALYAKENGIKGTTELDYVIGDKGNVITLNLLSSEGLTVPQKNAIKKYLFYRKFSFKAGKKSKHEFTHTFNF